MSKITELASGQIINSDAIAIVLPEPDDTPASVIIHWPTKPSVLDPKRFATSADAPFPVPRVRGVDVSGRYANGRSSLLAPKRRGIQTSMATRSRRDEDQQL